MTEALWSPGTRRIQDANITRFMQLIRQKRDPGINDYASLYRFSIDSPKAFWRAMWEFGGVIGSAGSRTVENFERMPGAQWFPDASLNFAENLLRYRDDREALVFKSETGLSSSLSYRQLYNRVAGVASALRAAGIEPGDRVAAYMPNLPETVIAMLATTSIGAIWSSCSPDFGINGVVDRLGQIEPKVLFCAAAYTYNGKQHDCLAKVKEIQKHIPSIQKIVVTPYVDPDPDLDGRSLYHRQAFFGLSGEQARWVFVQIRPQIRLAARSASCPPKRPILGFDFATARVGLVLQFSNLCCPKVSGHSKAFLFLPLRNCPACPTPENPVNSKGIETEHG